MEQFLSSINEIWHKEFCVGCRALVIFGGKKIYSAHLDWATLLYYTAAIHNTCTFSFRDSKNCFVACFILLQKILFFQFAFKMCFSLFQHGIKPMWEDSRNKQGGRWLINVNKSQRMSDLNNYWLEIVSINLTLHYNLFLIKCFYCLLLSTLSCPACVR